MLVLEDNRIYIRAIFSKSGRAVFISHLDLIRCIQRSFKRAKIPIWYTNGFNPHSYIMFPLALSLGLKSSYEVMDFAITEDIPFDEIKKRLNKALPDGLFIEKLVAPIKKHTEITSAEYILTFINSEENKNTVKKFSEFLNQQVIEVEKFSKKKGNITVDVKDDIIAYDFTENDDKINIYMKLSAGTERNININVILDSFEKYSGLKFHGISIERTKILCENNEDFI